jgi:hypothetical protein
MRKEAELLTYFLINGEYFYKAMLDRELSEAKMI